jgi:amino acid adenylation domain-containing protein
MKIEASYHQERLWFIDKFESGTLYDAGPVYHNIPLIVEITGSLDTKLLERSIRGVIDRHEALRTRIITIDSDSKPVQSIDPKTDFKLPVVDLVGDCNNSSIESNINLAIEESKRPFLLEREPLIRGKLLQVKEQTFVLVITIHHIIADKHSMEILLGEMFRYYEAGISGKALELPDLSIHYADFSRWQRELPAKTVKSLLFYWKSKLKGKLQALQFSTDRPRAVVHTYHSARQSFVFSKTSSRKIETFGRNRGIDKFTLFLAAFKVLLHRYSGLDEVVVGTFASALNKVKTKKSRNQPGTGRVIGPIDNLLVLRNVLSGSSGFRNVLSGVARTIRDALKYQDMPFDRLVLELNPHKDMSRTALFDVLFRYEDEDSPPQTYRAPGLESLEIKVIDTNLGWGKYDLNILVKGGKEVFSGVMVYNADYYDPSTISRLIDHYKILLEKVVDKPDQPLLELFYLTGKEKYQLLTEWNRTAAHYPGDKTLLHIFEEQVEAGPDATAVVFQGRQLTYRELDDRANKIALYLKTNYKILPNDLVCITLDRSELMIIGLLGILKSGAAYVPIDPLYPQQRIDFILNDSKCKGVIRGGEVKEEYTGRTGGKGNPGIINNPEDTAYVIYTSGTTGYPRGCLISHRNVVRLLKNDEQPFDFNTLDVWITAHSFCFDFSVWEMYGALLNGGKLIIPGREEVRDINTFLSIIKQEKVTVLNQTPTAFFKLIEEEEKSKKKILGEHLRYVIFGGDKLEPRCLEKWINMYGLDKIRLINMYGITETTVHVTYYCLKESDIRSSYSSSPIGKPLPETTLYIFNRDLVLEPVGVVGELYVGGSGVGKGYLNNQELTCHRFIENPYNKGDVLYKTGDLGKRLADGNIVFSGRSDHQVKIRGFRIEPGEIESQLVSHKEIREAVVIDRGESGDKYLCAYIVSNRYFELPELRDYMLRRLPDYMIPSHFVQLDQIPLTSNNKIDREALPGPGTGERGEEYSAPKDAVEEKLVEIWADVLNLDRANIGIDVNFFEIGGHSLKATTMISKIHKELNARIPLTEVFTTPTIKGLSGYIRGIVKDTCTSIEFTEEKEYYPLSAAQRRLYSLQHLNEQATGYNMPSIVGLAGNLRKEKMEDASGKLISRHEILRASFHLIGGEPVQKICPPGKIHFEMEYYDISTVGVKPIEVEKIIQVFIRPFDLSKAPLLRLGMIKTGEEKHLLMTDMHHTISDGVSQSILVKDFFSLYAGETLPAIGIHYKDFAVWQNRDFKKETEILRQQKGYWLEEYKGKIPELNMPGDYLRPAIKSFEGNQVKFVIEEKLAAKLNTLTKETGTTLNIALLAIYNILLFKYTMQEDIVVGLPITGRRHADVQDIIGMFVNMLAIRNKIQANKTFREFLIDVKQKVLGAMENQDYQFEELISDLGLETDPGKNPLFNIVFNMINIDFEEIKNENLTIIPYEFEYKMTVFDLILIASEAGAVINMALVYSTKLYKRSTARKITERFIDILKQVVEKSNILLADIDVSHGLVPVKSGLLQRSNEFGF